MEEDNFLSIYINAFNKTILDLKDIIVRIEDEDKDIILSSSLCPSYELFVDNLIYGR